MTFDGCDDIWIAEFQFKIPREIVDNDAEFQRILTEEQALQKLIKEYGNKGHARVFSSRDGDNWNIRVARFWRRCCEEAAEDAAQRAMKFPLNSPERTHWMEWCDKFFDLANKVANLPVSVF
jgi:hypothetical protein